jgi:hypothetical protein
MKQLSRIGIVLSFLNAGVQNAHLQGPPHTATRLFVAGWRRAMGEAVGLVVGAVGLRLEVEVGFFKLSEPSLDRSPWQAGSGGELTRR